MRILFHVGVGNEDRPKRWSGVNCILSNLARSLESLGHECLVWCHKEAKHELSYSNIVYSKDINKKIKFVSRFNPDWVFTWNGSSEGDKKIVKHFGIDKMIFGELGFFDHYKTAYFDFSGTNSNSEVLYEDMLDYDNNIISNLVKKYKKPRLCNHDYLFIPLQDENDTQVVCHSPIKRMEDLLSFVEQKYKNLLKNNIKVLYKKHPQYRLPIRSRVNFIEVFEDVHHYIPYAKQVIGINSTVLFETLLYHKNIISFGHGLCSRKIQNDIDRKKFVSHCYRKQLYFDDLSSKEVVKKSYFYKRMLNNKF